MKYTSALSALLLCSSYLHPMDESMKTKGLEKRRQIIITLMKDRDDHFTPETPDPGCANTFEFAIKMFQKDGGDLTKPDKNGVTLLDMAKAMKHKKAVDALTTAIEAQTK